ncbi:MAG TPA: hypothetical protein VNF71_10375 [Acidimicrobiales bacterium]|nr:hypothetical protein [Acidimicrobiales bacterium]
MRGPHHVTDTSRRGLRLRPGGPVLSVAAAVIVIAVATDLSVARVHSSLPAAITLPAPGQAVGSDSGPSPQGQAPTSTTIVDTPTTVAPSPPESSNAAITPTAVPAQYPVAHPGGDNSSDGGDATDQVSGGSDPRASTPSTTVGGYGGDLTTTTTAHTDG